MENKWDIRDNEIRVIGDLMRIEQPEKQQKGCLERIQPILIFFCSGNYCNYSNINN